MGALFRGLRIGVGGFEKPVVLKQLLPEYASDPETTKLFVREARLSAMLDHQNIVHTLDLVQVDGTLYMVMEYVPGADLRALLRRVRRRGELFSPAAALLIGRALLDALDYAHSKVLADGTPLGFIHRDISPSNILLSAAGEVKLTDFGIAKAITHASTRCQVRGKVGYVSPEQARGEPLDARSDLYSLAVVLYEVLTGRRLFVYDTVQSLAAMHNVPIPPLSRHRPGLPAELDAIMARALAVPREQRFQSAREFQRALSDVVQRHGLLISHAELAVELRQRCGPDPSLWRRDEEHTGTARISAEEMDDEQSPVEDISAAEHVTPGARPTAKELSAAGRLLEQDGGWMGDATSLLWRTEPVVPQSHDTTQPVARQSPAYPGIAAMARSMVRDDATARQESQGSRLRGDDTCALPGGRTTQQMAFRSEHGPVSGGPMSAIAQAFIQLSWRGGMALAVVALLLLGIGILLGLLLSAGPPEEGGSGQGLPRWAILRCAECPMSKSLR